MIVFGGLERQKEAVRDERRTRLLRDFVSDLIYAVRSLRRSKLFTITAILTLSLSIAAAAIMFSLLDGVLIQRLPFADPDRLVVLAQRDSQGVATGVSYPNFLDWQSQATSGTFSGFGYIRGRGTTLSLPDGKHTLYAALTSPGFFSVLGQRPFLGRTFTSDEERTGVHVAVLAYSTWRDEFGGDRSTLGRSIDLGDGSYTVIGVLPPGVVYPSWANVYFPISTVIATEHALEARGLNVDSRAIARLAPSGDVTRAETELSGIAKRLSIVSAADARWTSVRAQPLRDEVLGNAASQLTMLTAAVGLVLLIGWFNVANLALVRGAESARELAIRTSLGASRGRIVRQVLTQYVLLATIAGGFGAIVAAWGLALIRQTAGAIVPRLDGVALNGRALHRGPCPDLHDRRRCPAGAPQFSRPGRGVEGRKPGQWNGRVAAARAIGIGDRRNRARVDPRGRRRPADQFVLETDARRPRVQHAPVDRNRPGAAGLPPCRCGSDRGILRQGARRGAQRAGVRTALSSHLPLSGAAFPTLVEIPGRDPAAAAPQALFRTISPEYIGTMEIPLRQGRGFTSADLTTGTAVS